MKLTRRSLLVSAAAVKFALFQFCADALGYPERMLGRWRFWLSGKAISPAERAAFRAECIWHLENPRPLGLRRTIDRNG